MANEMTWKEIKAAWEETITAIYEYMESLTEEKLRELEVELQDWLNEYEEPPNWFDQPEDFVRLRDEAHGWLHSYRKDMNVPEAHLDLCLFHGEIRTEVLRILENESRILGPLKFKLEVAVNFEMERGDGTVERINYFTVQRNPVVLNAFTVHGASGRLNELLEDQLEALANYTERGSGWVVKGISAAYLRISRFEPLRGGSYMPLLKFIQSKKAVVNIKNKDDRCLRWVIKAAKFSVRQNAERPSKYPKDADDGFDFTGISFPTPLTEIPKVEAQNNARINIFGYDERTKKINILHVSEHEGKDALEVNTLLMQKDMKSHYCYVKSLSALLCSQQQSMKHHVHYCKRCLKGFSSEHVLRNHAEHCKGSAARPTRIEMPEKGKNTLKFQNFGRQAPVPWVMYFDFESIIEKRATCINDPLISSTTKIATHAPCGFSLIAVRSDGHHKGPFLYRGKRLYRSFPENYPRA